MDYFSILNFDKEPFSNSPDPEIFFQSRQHMSCLQKLELSIRMRRGLNVVIGEVGTGKTTLCRQLIRSFDKDEKIECHLILDPSFSNAMEFLAAMAEMFHSEKPAPDATDRQLKEQIKNYLFSQGVDKEKTTLLIIDEGQKLPYFCLETLRELLNYETNDYKLLQITIFAQREFEETLATYRNFTDRINLHHTLESFDFHDTKAMIQFRLDQASTRGKGKALFNYPALWVIYTVTRGFPRKIINLCHLIVLTMIIQNRGRAGWFLAFSCARKVFPEQTRRVQRIRAGVLAGILVVSLAAGLEAGIFGGTPDRQDSAPALVMTEARQEPAAESRPAPLPEPREAEPTADPADSEEPARQEEPAEDRIAALIPQEPADTEIEPLPAPPSIPVVLPSTLPKKKFPELLGNIDVRPGETLGDMIRKLYGPWSFNKQNTREVLAVNQHIRRPDMIQVGEVVSFPALPVRLTPVAERVIWVEVARTEKIDDAYRFLSLHGGDAQLMLIIPSWDDRGELGFTILLEEYFGDKASALEAVRQLPDYLAPEAKLLAGLDRNRFFYK